MPRNRDISDTLYYAPAEILVALFRLLIGNPEKKQKIAEEDLGTVTKPAKKTYHYPGLFALLLNGLSGLAKSFTGLLSRHKKAIATAFWASLIVGSLVGICVAGWPLGLALITSIAAYGVSIYSIVGASYIGQVAGSIIAAAIVTSAIVYAAAIVGNTFIAIGKGFEWLFGKGPGKAPDVVADKAEVGSTSTVTMRKGLGAKNDTNLTSVTVSEDEPNVSYKGPFKPVIVGSPSESPILDLGQAPSASASTC